MPAIINLKQLLVLSALLMMLAGCGQKGALYLPENPPVTAAEAQETSVDTDEKDRQREQNL